MNNKIHEYYNYMINNSPQFREFVKQNKTLQNSELAKKYKIKINSENKD